MSSDRLKGADRVAQGLWQGSLPPTGTALAKAGFDMVVLAAAEFQPDGRSFDGVTVLHAPLHDGPLDPRSAGLAYIASVVVGDALDRGERVLVTCQMGLNRSGLIVAMTLRGKGIEPSEVIAMVRRARGGNALTNPHFVAEILHPNSMMLPASMIARRRAIQSSHRKMAARCR